MQTESKSGCYNGSMPYPDHLKENIPMIYLNNLVIDQLRDNYGAYGPYPPAKEDALNIGIRCNN